MPFLLLSVMPLVINSHLPQDDTWYKSLYYYKLIFPKAKNVWCQTTTRLCTASSCLLQIFRNKTSCFCTRTSFDRPDVFSWDDLSTGLFLMNCFKRILSRFSTILWGIIIVVIITPAWCSWKKSWARRIASSGAYWEFSLKSAWCIVTKREASWGKGTTLCGLKQLTCVLHRGLMRHLWNEIFLSTRIIFCIIL